MLSLVAKPLNFVHARRATFWSARPDKRSAACRAHPLLFALLFILFVANTAAAASVPLPRYEADIHQAVVELTALGQWAKADSAAQHAARVETTLRDVRGAVPLDVTVEWGGGKVRINNSWLEAELQNYERLPQSSPQRAETLARITERLSALEDRLRELRDRLSEVREQKNIAAERKLEEKARLESILRRDEFTEKQPEESALARMWRRFLEWWNSLFPRGKGLAPGQTSWLSFIALILVFGLVAGALSYAAWKLLPFFERRRARLGPETAAPRVILGERLTPDQSAADLLRDAEALARRGELRAAIRKAYVALLLELGERKVIKLAQNKTNHDYLRALRDRRQLLDQMQKLTNSFENHWYGFRQATADDWTDFRTGYEKVLSTEY